MQKKVTISTRVVMSNEQFHMAYLSAHSPIIWSKPKRERESNDDTQHIAQNKKDKTDKTEVPGRKCTLEVKGDIVFFQGGSHK